MLLLTPYGAREWIGATAIAAALAAGALVVGWWWAAVVVGAVWLVVLWFFRDPPRRPPSGLEPGALLSPADGRVSAVLDVEHHDATDGPARIVRIFLSVLDVHVNRAPCDGEVAAVTHTPGKHLSALGEASSRENESTLVTLRASGGELLGVRQVAGLVARRIVCPLGPGDRLARGRRYGMIKFGSTTELILPRPAEVAIHVSPGDRVRGGRTVIATLPPRGTAR